MPNIVITWGEGYRQRVLETSGTRRSAGPVFQDKIPDRAQYDASFRIHQLTYRQEYTEYVPIPLNS